MTNIQELTIEELWCLLPGFSLFTSKGLSPHIYNKKYYIEKVDCFIIGYDLGNGGFKMIGRVDTLEEILKIIHQ